MGFLGAVEILLKKYVFLDLSPGAMCPTSAKAGPFRRNASCSSQEPRKVASKQASKHTRNGKRIKQGTDWLVLSFDLFPYDVREPAIYNTGTSNASDMRVDPTHNLEVDFGKHSHMLLPQTLHVCHICRSVGVI